MAQGILSIAAGIFAIVFSKPFAELISSFWNGSDAAKSATARRAIVIVGSAFVIGGVWWLIK